MWKIRIELAIIGICLLGIILMILDERIGITDAVLIFLMAALFESMRRAGRIDYGDKSEG